MTSAPFFARSNLLGRFLRRCGDLGEKARAVAARNGHARTGRDDARARITARFDSVAHGDIRKQRVSRAADGGHAACELRLRVLLDDAPQDGAPNGIVDLFISDPASPAETGLPEPQK